MTAKASREDSDFRSHGFRREAPAVIDAKATPGPLQTNTRALRGTTEFAINHPNHRTLLRRAGVLFRYMPLITAIMFLFSSLASANDSVDCESIPGPLVKVSPSYKPKWVPEEGARIAVSFTIGEDGLAKDIEIVESAGKKLDKAATRALKRWLYHPKFAGCSRQESFELSKDV